MSFITQIYLLRPQPWPVVERFLLELPKGSFGTDVGCGNGKYFQVNPHIFTIGNDHSASLLSLALQTYPRSDFFQADHLYLPFPSNSLVPKISGTFLHKFLIGFQDFSMSIAVLHHLATPERRLAAVKELLRITKPNGKILIFVWAFEQKVS